MKEHGRIIRNIGPDLVEVELTSSSSCSKCGVCHLNKTGALTLDAVDSIGVLVGDEVEVFIPEGRVILSSILIFIVPLLAFFAGYLLKGALLGSFLLFIYLIVLYYYDRSTKVHPQITSLLSNR